MDVLFILLCFKMRPKFFVIIHQRRFELFGKETYTHILLLSWSYSSWVTVYVLSNYGSFFWKDSVFPTLENFVHFVPFQVDDLKKM